MIASQWMSLDVAQRMRFITAAQRDAWMAHAALAALLPIDNALTDDHTLALARTAFPNAAWNTLDALPPIRRSALVTTLAPILQHAASLIVDPLGAEPNWFVHDDGGSVLTDDDQAALACIVARDACLAQAFVRISADLRWALGDRARRILARALLPVHAALAALHHPGVDARAIACRLPIDSLARLVRSSITQSGVELKGAANPQ